MRENRLWILLASLLLIGCQSPDSTAPPDATDSARAPEVAPQPLPLSAPLDTPSVEASGLTWYGDTLVVLPQYPAGHGADDPRLYGISRAQLQRAVDDTAAAPIEPFPIPVTGLSREGGATQYQGVEALAFDGARVYALIEADTSGPGMQGRLVQGRADPSLRRIRMQPEAARRLPQQAALPNMSYEALTTRGDTAIALFEANGARVNDAPRAYRVDDALQPVGSVPFSTLEYRLTDATALDAQNRFWVINYFYPEERAVLRPASDSLARRHGTGRTHRTAQAVERLVEYRYTPRGIRRTDTPPLWLELAEAPRNWEGLARLGTGFLVMTDQFPSTRLAYVPGPSSESE